MDSPKKQTDEFDLFAVKNKKANKTNSSVPFWEKLVDHKLLSRITDLYCEKIRSSDRKKLLQI